MARQKKTSTKKASKTAGSQVGVINVIVPAELTPQPSRAAADFEKHGGIIRAIFGSKVGSSRKPEEIKKEWATLSQTMNEIVADSMKKAPAGIRLEEITFALAVSGEGNIGFASAGAEASIELVFKRG